MILSINSFGQPGSSVSATSTATATIVTPIAISKSIDMNFGNLSVNANAGTVVITPAGARSATGGVSLPVVAGTVSATSFAITGQASYTYSITLPSSATTLSDGSGHSMTVDTWTSSPTPTGTLSSGGAETLKVGATLNITGSQAAGIYTSATPFTVTVNYN